MNDPQSPDVPSTGSTDGSPEKPIPNIEVIDLTSDAGIMWSYSFLVRFENVNFLAINSASANHKTFESKDVPETCHEALMAFFWTGKVWSVAMYHAAHRKDVDLERIAKKFKGGQNGILFGFTCAQPPFPLFPRMQ